MITVRTAAVVLGLALAGCGGEASPSPGPIVFSARPDDPEAFGWQLLVVNPDGTGLRRLTRTDGDGAPSWSPNGTKVAFTRSTSDACGLPFPVCTQIRTVNADGTSERPLTSVDERLEAPAWSPDGKRIAFAKWDNDRIGNSDRNEVDIYAMNSDGTEMTRLTDLPGEEEDPTWSPDGEHT